MTTYVFDIEGNGTNEIMIDKSKRLVPECDTVHCLVLRSYPDGETQVFRQNDEEDTIAEGVRILQDADVVIGHGIIHYDLPVLVRLYGLRFKGRAFDTLVAARPLWPDAKNHPFGGNGVENFGNHLGVPKIGLDITDWSEWTPNMEARCINDCVVQHRIFDFIEPKCQRFRTAVRLEHRVATICARMQDNGVSINVTGAEDLIDHLEQERSRHLQTLQDVFPPQPSLRVLKSRYWRDPETGRLYETKKEASKDVAKRLVAAPWHKMRVDWETFNPNSSAMIAARLKGKYDWDAPLTEKGNPTLPEDVLKGLGFDECDPLLRTQMADKRLQHLVDWVRRARESRTPGRIHPQVNPCGCATSRASHQQPNQTAAPKVLDALLRGYEGRYGWEMRELWGPREGLVQVGADASGLELRELGHALFPYDGGAYAREVVTGDVHTLNQKAGGLWYRDQAKTVIYAYLYGAGDAHIGFVITNHGALTNVQVKTFADQRVAWVKSKRGQTVRRGKRRGLPYDDEDWYALKGKQFRDTFEAKLPALAKLRAWCTQCASEKGYVPLLDGRHAPIRSEHAALNTLLQGNGAITMKLAMVLLHDKLTRRDWMWTRAFFMLWPHDEFQLEAEPEIAEEVGQCMVESIVEAGVRLKLNCPLDGEYKVGANWAETH